jgi:hypothetical protein
VTKPDSQTTRTPAIQEAITALNKAEKQFLFYATEHRKQGKTGKAATNYEYGLLCGYALEHLKLTTRCEHEIEVKSSPQGE